MVPPVFNIYRQSLRDQKPKPLQSLRVEASFGESVLPVRDTQVHNHQSEVIGKGVCEEKPVAREVLEPDLRLCVSAFVDYCEPSIFHFGVDIESVNFLPVFYESLRRG